MFFFLILALPLFGREVPSLTGAVVDEASLLSSNQRQEFEGALRNFYAKTGKQIQLVIINSLEGDSLEEFSIRLAEKWKIGSHSGTGVILLVALEDRQMRIEVGQGIEGELTDAEAGRIIRGVITPLFKESHFVGGVAMGLAAIAASLGEDLNLNQKYIIRTRGRYSLLGNLFYLFVWIFILLPLFFGRRIRTSRGSVLGALVLGNILGGSSRGGFGGGGFGGGWSGGGGGFSGGGASGRW